MKKTFGEYIRVLREEVGLPLRKVSAVLDIDPSTLSKIERGERSANKEMIGLLAGLFNENERKLELILMSDKIAYELVNEENPKEILQVAEEKIKYLKNKKLKQGELDLQIMTLKELEIIWEEFSNIPINIDDEILEDFYH